jgi:N-acetylglucosamine kinase-like BadF-type ATPase
MSWPKHQLASMQMNCPGGSAYDLGARALQAVLKAHDGRGAPTSLTRTLLRRLALGQPEQLVAWAYSPEGDQTGRVADLAQAVVECALAGDVVAESILWHGVGELAR